MNIGLLHGFKLKSSDEFHEKQKRKAHQRFSFPLNRVLIIPNKLHSIIG